jgi:hypothetical protein
MAGPPKEHYNATRDEWLTTHVAADFDYVRKPDQQWVPNTILGSKILGPVNPVSGKVVGLVEFKGRVIIAFEFGVYELADGVLVRIKFEGEEA